MLATIRRALLPMAVVLGLLAPAAVLVGQEVQSAAPAAAYTSDWGWDGAHVHLDSGETAGVSADVGMGIAFCSVTGQAALCGLYGGYIIYEAQVAQNNGQCLAIEWEWWAPSVLQIHPYDGYPCNPNGNGGGSW